MNNLYDVLEVCLQEIANGMDIEVILARYPNFSEELRPILQASMNAKQMAASEPSSDVVRRNRAKLLQHAAQMRESQTATTKTNRWFPSLQRLAIALVILILFFASGTSLVRASALALPGDGLYSVKRSWEDVALLFTFDTKAHETLQVEYENERLDEINKLFASGRSVKVEFNGIVTRQNGDGWRIANVVVIVSNQTKLPGQPIQLGVGVRVLGTTNGDGIVLAEQIELLSASVPLPAVTDDQPVIETEQPQATSKPDSTGAGSESVAEAPEVKVTITPSPRVTPQVDSFENTLNSIDKDVWTVDNILVNIADAEIKGVPVLGAHVKVEGYYGADGVFVATKVEIINDGSGNSNGNLSTNNGGSPNLNSNGSDGSNSNSHGGSNNNSNDGGGSNDDGDSGGGGGGNGNGG